MFSIVIFHEGVGSRCHRCLLRLYAWHPTQELVNYCCEEEFTKSSLRGISAMKAAFASIFGRKKPLKEVLRENKRTITRAIRDIEREKTNLEKQEKKLVGEIKKNAKAGQMGAVKVSAWTERVSHRTESTRLIVSCFVLV